MQGPKGEIMKRTNTLSYQLIEELAGLLNAESQLVEALPKMADASQLSAIRISLEDFLQVTKEHVSRLQDIFSNIGQSPKQVTCQAMKELITEVQGLVSKAEKSPASDAAILNVLQRMQQYEVARYKAVREHSADLGHTKIVEVFTKILNEDRAINFHFNELAQGVINVQAIDPSASSPKGGGFYIPEGKFKRGGTKKKPKGTDISRFISEGNPNIQEPLGKEEKEENGTG